MSKPLNGTQYSAAHRHLPLTFTKATRAHEEHPERNEDYGLTDPESRLAIICDGVGNAPGVTGPAQAARIAARTVRTHWRQTLARLAEESAQIDEQNQAFDLETSLRQLLAEANQAVCVLDARLAKRAKENDKQQGYAATTIALALLLPQGDGYLVGYAHVGDSRVYLLRQNEPLQRLTADDGYFEWKIGKDELNAQEAWRIEQASCAEQLSEQDLEHFDKRNRISQALGDEAITLHTGQIAIRPGDRLLLSTDGIHDNLTDAEIEETARTGTRTTAAKTLLKRTVERSQQDGTICLRAKKDDMSIIVITCHALSGNLG
jgi:PPM family protein phosphatase